MMEGDPDTATCTYQYDALDRLARTATAEQPAVLRFYLNKRLLGEIQGAVGRTLLQHGDILLAQQDITGSAASATLLASDRYRSALHALNGTADQAPRYTPYGFCQPAAEPATVVGFNGECADPLTGHILLGSYRVYTPRVMRFHSPDNLSPFGKGGINPYAYCQGDPLNNTDPTGHNPLKAISKAASAVFKGKDPLRDEAVEGIQELFPNVHSFITRGEKGKTLNIHGHGILDENGDSLLTSLGKNGEQIFLGGDTVGNKAMKAYPGETFSKARLIPCMSLVGQRSFAGDFARTTGLRTKGAFGLVRATTIEGVMKKNRFRLNRTAPGFMPGEITPAGKVKEVRRYQA
ncbi:hypothetical protein DCO48_02725 [Pseudomonas sp. SDI]|uniref:RHS repeat-associated core domain-containing protein n=1 Tax=Pseudomonas sp. SDI TaxID=2170734 RepID=UPI000DE6688F|nr:RHS repeat-associated core domain-containing protein [Pseudomonas sp. SDI]PWB35352.1 hypothetical protein DCO48_02725 [Pseudomonas sp. SDI]